MSISVFINQAKDALNVWRHLSDAVGPIWASIILGGVGASLCAGLLANRIYRAAFNNVIEINSEIRELGTSGVPQSDDSRRGLNKKRDFHYPRYAQRRAELLQGGWYGQQYRRLLTGVLKASDKFFGDGIYQRRHTRTDNWFDGRIPKSPYWTGYSLDRCLLLALIYPLFSLLFIWAFTNDAGTLGGALGLPEDRALWQRLAALICMPVAAYSYAQVFRPGTSVQRRVIFGLVSLVAFAVAFAFAGAGAVAFASQSHQAHSSIRLAVAGAFAFAVAFAVAVAVAVAVALMWGEMRGRFGGALMIMLGAYALAIPLVLHWSAVLAGPQNSDITSPILLVFFGALPLINALFDWVSLGVTRMALRFGLVPSWWRPWIASLIDLALAIASLFGLMAVTIIYLKILNEASVLGGGAPVLDLDGLYKTITEPGDKPYGVWWIYITIFTTFIPSLVNMLLAALSFIRVITPIQFLIAKSLPEEPEALTVAGAANASLFLGLQWGGATAMAILLVTAFIQGAFWLIPGVGEPLTAVAAWAMALEWPEALVNGLVDRLDLPLG